jgi:hypothetical protein
MDKINVNYSVQCHDMTFNFRAKLNELKVKQARYYTEVQTSSTSDSVTKHVFFFTRNKVEYVKLNIEMYSIKKCRMQNDYSHNIFFTHDSYDNVDIVRLNFENSSKSSLCSFIFISDVLPINTITCPYTWGE